MEVGWDPCLFQMKAQRTKHTMISKYEQVIIVARNLGNHIVSMFNLSSEIQSLNLPSQIGDE